MIDPKQYKNGHIHECPTCGDRNECDDTETCWSELYIECSECSERELREE